MALPKFMIERTYTNLFLLIFVALVYVLGGTWGVLMLAYHVSPLTMLVSLPALITSAVVFGIWLDEQ